MKADGTPAADAGTRLRVLVYPHVLTVGGSQLNAVELAGAVRDLGHEVVVFGTPGPLVEVVRELDLPYVESPPPGRRPSVDVVKALRATVRDREIDVLHGYEWPPALECYLVGDLLERRPAVCTVMSMAVAPFIPSGMPLMVGTRHIQATVQPRRTSHVTLLEPPVDTWRNGPEAPRGQLPVGLRPEPGVLTVVVVSRLARELKLQGLLEAVSVMPQLAAELPVRLVVVGGGPARAELTAAALCANRLSGREVVVLTGEVMDPRPLYALADVCLGMGGSAVRALAHARPLVVQGEEGFWEELNPSTVQRFLYQGWYGTGDGTDGSATLLRLLRRLLTDPQRRAELGAFGRQLAEDRFSLDHAARVQAEVYADAVRQFAIRRPPIADALRSGAGLARHVARRRVHRLLGRHAEEDFNAVQVQPPVVGVPA